MKRIISHRGNLNGREPCRENSPQFIKEALQAGFDVEVDVWLLNEGWFLGHDEPEHQTTEDFLRLQGLWCHAKNLRAFKKMLEIQIVCFWHESDRYALTSNGFIWTYPGMFLSSRSICVMPESGLTNHSDLPLCAGICTDFPIKYWKEERTVV